MAFHVCPKVHYESRPAPVPRRILCRAPARRRAGLGPRGGRFDIVENERRLFFQDIDDTITSLSTGFTSPSIRR